MVDSKKNLEKVVAEPIDQDRELDKEDSTMKKPKGDKTPNKFKGRKY